MGIIVSEENSKTVVRVERWKQRIVMAWLMIRKEMMCVMSVYGPQTGRMEVGERGVHRCFGEDSGIGGDGDDVVYCGILQCTCWSGTR